VNAGNSAAMIDVLCIFIQEMTLLNGDDVDDVMVNLRMEKGM
jgi:hypothetical protein